MVGLGAGSVVEKYIRTVISRFDSWPSAIVNLSWQRI